MAVIFYISTLVFHGDSNFLMNSWPPRSNDFNFYVIGKKNMLSLQCDFLVLGNRVESI